MKLIYILAAVLIFGILVAVHELGHFLAAKLCGVRVNEFSIGMGPNVWSRKRGETQCVGFIASFLDDAYAMKGEKILEPAAGLLCEVLLKPYTEKEVFSAGYVSGEKANLIDRIRAQINDKRTYATQRLTQEMCKYEAFGVDKLGDEESVSAITPESLWQRYQELLATAQVEVYYCGSAEPDRVAGALKQALDKLPVNQDRTGPDCDVRVSAGPEPIVAEECMDVSQGKLALGFRTGGLTCWETDYPALYLAVAVFGGTTLSKLFMNVREKLSLCYYASATLEKMKGLVLVSSGIEFDKYQTAKDEILAQLEAVRRGALEDWELEAARSTLLNAYASMGDSQGKLENFFLGQAATGQDESPESLAEQVRAVTPERIFEAMGTAKLETEYFLQGKEAEA